MLRQKILKYHIRLKHSSPALDKIREKIENGPRFQDFIQSPSASREEIIKEFDGKLKREKNDKDRLRLPPWLKTKIPIGKRSILSFQLQLLYNDFY